MIIHLKDFGMARETKSAKRKQVDNTHSTKEGSITFISHQISPKSFYPNPEKQVESKPKSKKAALEDIVVSCQGFPCPNICQQCWETSVCFPVQVWTCQHALFKEQITDAQTISDNGDKLKIPVKRKQDIEGLFYNRETRSFCPPMPENRSTLR